MRERDQDEGFAERERAQEGAFDQQLSFPAPFVEAPQPIKTIIKRDGREVSFNQGKIAEAIFKAAQSIGGTDRDRAESLAAGVSIYLMKSFNGQTSTVDQVHDAVEKVLIEMGHARTALAYVRYRDRRARIRKLREGDTRALLNELAEAQREGTVPAGPSGGPLLVRTSAETLSEWDRDRIVAALVRETGLEDGLANVIALEVEQQIRSAKVTTLTAPLIRELVSAKLVEHGLEEHCRRHMRLGVPLYDAERIICGPHPGEAPVDPVATDLVLAESVKREFALTQVFSRSVADAHLRGDIHLHGLGFVDRLHSSTQSLEYIKRFGAGFPGSRSVSRPPKYPDTLLAQMVHMNAALQSHFAGPVGWDAFNVFFAPFVHGLDDKRLRQVAQMVIFEYAHRAVAHGERMPPTEITICWDVPRYLRDIEAVGPGGKYTGRSYAEYGHTVQQFAWALLDVFNEGGVGGSPFRAPVPLLCITPEFFKAPGHETFLDHVADVAGRRGNIHILFDRHRFGGIGPAAVWKPRYTAVQCVTLNLPRAAYRVGNERELLGELDRLARVVVQAQLEKRAFVEKLLSLKNLGPLALLAVEREGKPYLELDQATYLISVMGLNECVQALTGEELHDSEKALALAGRIAEHLSARFGQSSEDMDLNFALAQTADAAVARRLAALDLHDFPDRARAVVKTDSKAHEIYYTAGAQLNPTYECNPIERVRIEGQFHEWLRAGAFTQVHMPDDQTSKESIAGFINKAYYQTQTHRVVFRESSTD